MEPFEYTGRNWFTIIGWGFFGSLSIFLVCLGIFLFPYGWQNVILIVFGLPFLVASCYFGRTAYAMKHLTVGKDGISYFSGEAKVFEACWNEVEGVRFHPKMTQKSTSVIYITINGHEFKLTGEDDLPPLQIEDIFQIIERAWKEAKGIAVESG